MSPCVFKHLLLLLCLFVPHVFPNPSTYVMKMRHGQSSNRKEHYLSLGDALKANKQSPYKNRHPVIGILAQETGEAGNSYIYEAYVKFIEQSGALVVPVRIDEPAKYYEDLFQHLNGVVFPGGGVSLTTSGYARSAQYFFNLSKEAFDKGDVFPILGICQGFEELNVLAVGNNPLVKCQGEDLPLPIYFTNDARSSRLFKDTPDALYSAMGKWNLTFNNHQYCMTTKVFRETKKLTDFYKVLSTNVDENGLEFVSSFEAKKYPIYGLQWHPAKNIYLWSDARVNHSRLAVEVAQYISNFFVDQARPSTHHFPTLESLAAAVISNYQPVFKGAPSFHSVYEFPVSVTTDADSFLVWDWPRFNRVTDIGMSQFLNFLLFLLMLLLLLGILSALMRQRAAVTYYNHHNADSRLQ